MPVLQAVCEYKNVSGCSIQADVFLPSAPRPSDAHSPVLLYIHGGGLISGSRDYLPAYQVDLFRRAGFAVISIDYRLAPETRLEEILTDIQDALRWVKGEAARIFGFDPERLAVIGASGGGYLALMTGTFEQKPRAIVSLYGYGDILGDWYCQPSAYYRQSRPLISHEEANASVGGREKSSGGKERYTFYFYCRQQGTWTEAVSGYNPFTEREKILPFCPAYNVHPDYPPTLLLHGDADTDVPYGQSIQMAAALTRQRVPNRLILMQGMGHVFDADRDNLEVKRAMEEVVDFLITRCK